MKKIISKKKPLHIVFLGPQGSGKGTQAEMLSEEFNIPRISPGDIFRREIKKNTKLGKLIASYINKGNLAPEDLTNKIIVRRLRRSDCKKGFILDGFPRNMIQLNALEKMVNLNYVIFINISDKEAIRRLSGRRVCKCGMTYHLKFNPSKKKGICDKCGGKLFQRKDDTIKVIKKRLKIYHNQTEPLVTYFKKKGVLIEVDGEQPIKKVYRDIIRKMLGDKNKILNRKSETKK